MENWQKEKHSIFKETEFKAVIRETILISLDIQQSSNCGFSSKFLFLRSNNSEFAAYFRGNIAALWVSIYWIYWKYNISESSGCSDRMGPIGGKWPLVADETSTKSPTSTCFCTICPAVLEQQLWLGYGDFQLDQLNKDSSRFSKTPL